MRKRIMRTIIWKDDMEEAEDDVEYKAEERGGGKY
jgi:hypothetical protein